MPVPAEIKFVQGGNTPPGGQALDNGATGVLVTATNVNDSGIVSHAWLVVDAPPGSAVSGTGTSASFSFTPDVGPGMYLIGLTTTDVNGVVTKDYKAVVIRDAVYSRSKPPSAASIQGDLMLNVGGQTRGFAPFLEPYLQVVDRLGDVGGSAPTNGQVLAWVAANHRYEPATPSGGAGAFVNGGNAFGADAALGTTDAHGLVIQGSTTHFAPSPGSVSQIAIGANIAMVSATAAGVTIGAQGTSFWSVTGANLTLQTITSGTLSLTSAGAFNLTGVGAGVVGTTGANLTLQTTTSGNLSLVSAGTLSADAASSVAVGTGTALSVSVGQSSGANLSLTSSGVSQLLTGSGGRTLVGNGTLGGPGSLVLDASTVAVGNTNATSLTFGNAANTASIVINGTAALTSNSASATGGVAIPATCEEFEVIMFRGNIRKRALFAA